MKLREKQKEKSIIHIGEVALDLFYEKGFTNTKINDIAQAADVSVGLISYYFGSKKQLFEAIIEMSFTTIKEIEAQLAQPGSPLTLIEAAGESLLKKLAHDTRAAKLFALIYDVNYNPQGNKQISKLIPKIAIHEQTTTLVMAGQKNKEIRPGNPQLLSQLYWDSFSLLAMRIIEDEDEVIPDIKWFTHLLRE